MMVSMTKATVAIEESVPETPQNNVKGTSQVGTPSQQNAVQTQKLAQKESVMASAPQQAVASTLYAMDDGDCEACQ